MKAIIMHSTGTPEVLNLEEVPMPLIDKENKVLVKLKAAGINPIDTKLRSRGTFYPQQMPAILGCDGAGIVEQIGAGVTKFQVGDPVFYCADGLGAHSTGNYAEYAVISEHRLVPKPQSISFSQAAALPLCLITAWEALYDRGRLEANSKVLIHGGGGGVGHLAIQLAKIKGAQVATTVSSEEKAKLVFDLGADLIINYRKTDFVESILDWTDGKGADLVLDTVGGKVFFNSFAAVKVYGDLVTILSPDLKKENNLNIARTRNLRISLELMLSPEILGLEDYQTHQAWILQECGQLVDQGKLKVHLSKLFPLTDAWQAHQEIETGSTMGKIVLLIEDDKSH